MKGIKLAHFDYWRNRDDRNRPDEIPEADGHQIWVLTRNPDAAHLPEGARAVGWDGRTSQGWGEIVNRMDAVVKLVGERLSKWPWTKRQKNRFWDSRVDGGRALVEAIRAASTPPKVLIQASGINYYGPRDLSPVTEAELLI